MVDDAKSLLDRASRLLSQELVTFEEWSEWERAYQRWLGLQLFCEDD